MSFLRPFSSKWNLNTFENVLKPLKTRWSTLFWAQLYLVANMDDSTETSFLGSIKDVCGRFPLDVSRVFARKNLFTSALFCTEDLIFHSKQICKWWTALFLSLEMFKSSMSVSKKWVCDSMQEAVSITPHSIKEGHARFIACFFFALTAWLSSECFGNVSCRGFAHFALVQ